MKKILLVTLALSFVFAGSLSTFGQGQPNNAAGQRERIEFTQSRGQLIDNRCGTILERIEKVSTTTAAVQNRSFGLLTDLQSKLGEFANSAENAGFDVTQFKADLSELGKLSGALSTAWQDFLTALESVGDGIDCQSDEVDAESIHDSIEAAKDAKAELKLALSSLIEFVQTTIRNDLADIRQQITARDEG